MKIKMSNLLFFMAWFIYFSSYIILKQTEINAMYDTSKTYVLLNIITIIILLLKILLVDKYNLKTLIMYGIISLIFIISTKNSGSDFLLFGLLFVLSSRNIDFDGFIKFDIKIRFMILILIISLCILGYLPNFSRIISGAYKQALGFYHPNTLGVYTISILLEILYLLKGNYKIIHYIFFIISLLIINYFCQTRSSIFLFIFSLIITIIFNKKNFEIKKNKHIRIIFEGLPAFSALFSFMIIKLYNIGNNFGLFFNSLVTTRIKYGNIFLKEYGLSLFGKSIDTIGTRQSILLNENSKILDMGYIHLGINNGILILIIFIIFLTLIQKKAVENNNKEVLVCNTFFILLGVVETYIYILAFNFIILIYFYLNSKNREGDKSV